MNSVLRAFTAFLLTVLFLPISLLVGCKSKNSSQAEKSQGGNQAGAQNQKALMMSVDDLVAPIALYPDQLLAQVLTVSTNAQEVLDVGNWLLQNQNLQGDALTNAAKQAGFSPSAQYLVLFPQVVDNMCQEIDWTRQLGTAFQEDQKGVMDAVQRKRVQAQQMGNLSSSPQMAVQSKQTDKGQPYVEIKPADPKVVYVPQYNPETIYTNPAPAFAPVQTTTTTETNSGVGTGTAVAIGLLSFGVGMAVGNAIHSDDYYPYPAWGYGGGVYYGGRPYYPPPYHPVYAGYRPAYGYNPPGNYHWNQYNHNVNVNVNNNYYGRFRNTDVNTRPVNTRPGYGNQNLASNNLANNRPGVANQGTWKGQSTYQGARNNNLGNQRPGSSMTTAIPRNQQVGDRANVGNRGTTMASTRDVSRPSAAQPVNRGGDRGYGSAARPDASAFSRPNAGQPGNVNRASASPQPMNRGGDSGASRPMSSAASRPTPSPEVQNRGGAFGGGGTGSGSSARAASNRGRSSMNAPSRGANHAARSRR